MLLVLLVLPVLLVLLVLLGLLLPLCGAVAELDGTRAAFPNGADAKLTSDIVATPCSSLAAPP